MRVFKPSFQKIVIAFATLVIFFGIHLRFSNLDLKIFWYDEAISATRIVGSFDSSEIPNFFKEHRAKLTPISEFSKLREQQSDKNILNTLKVSLPDSHVAPLYYLIGHIWVSAFGDSITAIRSLSAIFGVGAIGAMLWCASILFNSSQAGFMAAALLASSPFMVLYSQEARMYSLWALTILICHSCFIQAIRNPTRRSWLLYSISTAVSFYSHLFTLFVIASHCAYIFLTNTWLRSHFDSSKVLKKFSLSIILIFSLFAPWIVVILAKASDVKARAGWLDAPMPWNKVINTFLASIANVITSVSNHALPFWERHGISSYEQITFLFIFGIVFAALYSLLKSLLISQADIKNSSQKNIGLFLICLFLAPVFFFVLPSAILGKTLGNILRYYVPIILSIQLALTFFIFYQRTSTLRKGSVMIWALLCILSLESSHQAVAKKTSWTKGYDSPLWDVIEDIKSANQPIVFTTSDLGVNLLTLSYYLDPKTQLLVTPSLNKLNDTDISAIQNQMELGQEILVFQPSTEAIQKLADLTGYQTQVLQDKGNTMLSRLVTSSQK